MTSLNLDSLTFSEKQEALEILLELQRRKSRRTIDTYYPDTGPLCRAAYPKHMEFFDAGRVHSERAFVGGNRCLTPWTAIETDRGERRCEELLGEAAIGVRSWDGGSLRNMRASGLFLKGIEPAFRVHLDNGEFFDCTRRHRVLTTLGWEPFYQIMLGGEDRRWFERGSAECVASFFEDDPGRLAELFSIFRDPKERTRIGRYLLHPSHMPLVGSQQIIAVEDIGCQPIIDLEVEGTHNYRAGGVFHHNTGKSFCIGYEGTVHLTGVYPAWWTGRRFDRPVVCWAAGEDSKAVRESLQATMMGPSDARGTGLIPGDALKRVTPRGGIPDAVDFAEIAHASGGTSRLVYKAYEQGRESFQASRVDVVLLDEEPPLSIYTEALTRTLATVPGEQNGCVMCAFTPLRGVSDTVLTFLPGGAYPATEELRRLAWGW